MKLFHSLLYILIKSVWLCTAIELFIILPPTDAFKTYVLYIGNYKLRTVVCQYQSNINSEKMF